MEGRPEVMTRWDSESGPDQYKFAAVKQEGLPTEMRVVGLHLGALHRGGFVKRRLPQRFQGPVKAMRQQFVLIG